MKTVARLAAISLLAMPLGACSVMGGEGFGLGGYTLVREGREMKVGNGALVVRSPNRWNKASKLFFDNIRETEDWTLNGPYLDGIMFITGLPDDKALVRQSRRDERQVPKFRKEMTAPEIATMIESAYRVRGGAVDFILLGLQPRPFLGYPGFQIDYEHLDSDELRRRGRAVGAIVGDRLYLIMLDAAKSHYYDAALADFEAIAASARRR